MAFFRVSGFKGLDEALAELPSAVRPAIVRRALRRAAQPIVDDARRRAPRGTDPRKRGSKKDRRTGKSAGLGPAADSIRATVVPSTSEHEASVAVAAGPRHFYLRFSEFGTSGGRRRVHVGYRPSTSKFSKNRTYVRKVWEVEMGSSRQPARPFLRPAFETQKERALAILADELTTSIDQAVRRVARQEERAATYTGRSG